MLYRRDPLTLEHLIIDGDEVLRLRTRVEALEIAHRRRRRAARSTSPRLAVS